MSRISIALLLLFVPLTAVAEGGETIETAAVISALPYADTGNTCGHVDDYNETCPYSGSTAPDVVYVYTPTQDIVTFIDLCASSYNNRVFVYANVAGNVVACDTDGCPLEYQGSIHYLHMTAGVHYFIVVDGDDSACGSYMLEVRGEPPCVVECPPGGQQEGEPPCADGYVDNYNSGCLGNGWTPISAEQGGCGDLCGRSCTYLQGAEEMRDFDWFTLTAEGGMVTAQVEAEFPVQFILIYGADCSNLQYDYAYGEPCQLVNLSRSFSAGDELWLFVSPSVFSGVPESKYWLHVCGVEGIPVPTLTTTWGRIKSMYRDR